MADLTGAPVLVRSALHRERTRIAVWIVAILLLVVVSASSVKGLYSTPDELREAAALIDDNPAAIAFNGPVQGLETIGGRIAFETGTIGLVLVAIMTVLMTSRLTRTEEELGRLELVRATVVGRDASLASALVVVTAMNVALGTVMAVALAAEDLPVTGSVTFGLASIAVGLVFAGVTAVAAQLTENARVASGLAGALIGVSFALRAAGDIGDGTLSWLSPIGWSQKTRPFAGEAWWPFAVPLLATGGLVVLAAVLAGHRDVGAGMLATRDGPSAAAPGLGRPIGLAFRLQRAAVFWWAVGVLALGLVYGSIADEIEDFVTDNEAIGDFLARGSGSLTDAFLATSLLVLALVASGAAVQAAVRSRAEEASGRAEVLLAGGSSRARWLGSHIAVAAAGSAAVVVAGGLGIGISYGIVIGDAGQVPRLAAASLVYVPAVWLLVGVAVFLVGIRPRVAAAAWGLLAFWFVAGFLGEALDLPTWLRQASPFEHAPLAPAEGIDVLPLALTGAIAVALIGGAVATFERRDVM